MNHSLTIQDMPPYGFINLEVAAEAVQLPTPMQSDPGAYDKLVSDLVVELSENIWPRFDPVNLRWQGGAQAHAQQLTLEDLDICERLAGVLLLPVGDGGPEPKTHLTLYKEEDGGVVDPCPPDKNYPFVIWGASFLYYDKSVLASDCKTLAADFNREGYWESGGLSVALKIPMQRPRPYQMTMLLGRASYAYRFAYTSATPALVSGHALQSAISGSYVFNKYQGSLLNAPVMRNAWAQFLVDVGDRRVFAGVHYPSDSIASWFCALRVAKSFYGSGVRDFLWAAIRDKSRVYAAVAAQAKANPQSPYGPILTWLAAEAAAQ